MVLGRRLYLWSSMMASALTRVWRAQSYSDQENTVWPKEGRHVLAQYDDDTVVVYQTYCPEIADYAVKHQKCVRVTCTVRLVPHKTYCGTERVWLARLGLGCLI